MSTSKAKKTAAVEWAKGSEVPFKEFALILEGIEELSGNKKIDLLAQFFTKVIDFSPEDLTSCVYLSVNQLGPSYEGLELGVAENSLIKAMANATGRSENKIKEYLRTEGDLGTVAQKYSSLIVPFVVPKALTVPNVFNKLTKIAKFSGKDSNNKKVGEIILLLIACQGIEARFLIRMLAGKLRIGLGEQSVLSALGHAFTLSNMVDKKISGEKLDSLKDTNVKRVKTAYCECPNYNRLIEVALSEGIEALVEKCKLTPGIPLKPMLAHPTKGIDEIMRRFGNDTMTCEWKYDGERGQIHRSEDGKVCIYSRNQENNTTKYPDIIKNITACVGEGVTSFIVDAEVVAIDDNGLIRPFQVLSTRKRKDVTDDNDVKVKVGVFLFDLLFLNGKPLVREPLRKRRELLRSNFKKIDGSFHFATSVDTNDTDEINAFFDEAVQNKCEGLMIKTLDVEATYEISKRSHSWLKMKKDYIEGVGDTLDLVVMGAYYGSGKRTGVYAAYLLGCYNSTTDEYESVCKIGTGFTDDDLKEQYKMLQDKKVDKAPVYYQFDQTLKPDDIFCPHLVFEIKCADITVSPRHKAASGLTEDGRGISLRFPRFLKIRDDKNADMATSSEQVLEMYKNQETSVTQKIEKADEEEEGNEDEEELNKMNVSEGSSNKENVVKEEIKEESPKKVEKKSPAKPSSVKKSSAKKETKKTKGSSVKPSKKEEIKKESPSLKKKKQVSSDASDSDDDTFAKKKQPSIKRSRVTIDSDSD